MKRTRQEKILELIRKNDIETQQELSERLRDAGFAVTQATISRDIKELKIVRISCILKIGFHDFRDHVVYSA